MSTEIGKNRGFMATEVALLLWCCVCEQRSGVFNCVLRPVHSQHWRHLRC